MKKILMLALLLANITQAADTDTRSIGDALQIALPAYACGMAMMEDGKQGVEQISYALVGTQTSSELLKRATQEKRPDWKKGDRRSSFPSGHSAAAFSGATFIHKRYGIERAVLPYALASFTAYSRVAAKKHYWHDVVAGGALAAAWTWAVVDDYPAIRITPTNGGALISYRAQFR